MENTQNEILSAYDQLIDAVIERIKEDVAQCDYTAIDELLWFCPQKYLIGFLADDGCYPFLFELTKPKM